GLAGRSARARAQAAPAPAHARVSVRRGPRPGGRRVRAAMEPQPRLLPTVVAAGGGGGPVHSLPGGLPALAVGGPGQKAMGADPVLKSVPWLAQLGPAALDEVAEVATRVQFRRDDALLVELEVGEALYILVEGRARVSVSAGLAARRDVAMLGAG